METEKSVAAQVDSYQESLEAVENQCNASFRCGGWQEYKMGDVTYAKCQLAPHDTGKHYFSGERGYFLPYDEVNDKWGEYISQKYEIYWETDENKLEDKYPKILRG